MNLEIYRNQRQLAWSATKFLSQSNYLTLPKGKEETLFFKSFYYDCVYRQQNPPIFFPSILPKDFQEYESPELSHIHGNFDEEWENYCWNFFKNRPQTKQRGAQFGMSIRSPLGVILSQMEFYDQIAIEPSWDSKNHQRTHKYPLEFWELPFVNNPNGGLMCEITYPMNKVIISSITCSVESITWNIECFDKNGEGYFKFERVSNFEVPLHLAVIFFFDPELHNSNWVYKNVAKSIAPPYVTTKELQSGEEPLEINNFYVDWLNISTTRMFGWYWALRTRKVNYNLNAANLPVKKLWHWMDMAFYYRYLMDFMDSDGKEYDVEDLLMV